MQWTLHYIGVKPSVSLWHHADRRVYKPLKSMERWIRSVTLRFRDTDQSDLSAGRHVKAVVELANGKTLVVDQASPDFYSGLDKLADRLKRHVRKQADKRIKKRHRRH